MGSRTCCFDYVGDVFCRCVVARVSPSPSDENVLPQMICSSQMAWLASSDAWPLLFIVFCRAN